MEGKLEAAAQTSPGDAAASDCRGQEEEQEQQEPPVMLSSAPAVLKKGQWTAAEDAALLNHVRQHGEGNWNAVQRTTGLMRCGKSCRLRWTNHLRPNLKKGSFSPDEELLIAQLHAQLGNKWARMASHLPGRTDNEIKNYWNTRTKRRQRAGLPVYPPELHLQLAIHKRCRYDDLSPLSSPQQSGSNVVRSLDAADATSSAGYTSARPPPLDLAGQLAMPSRHAQFLAPTPFSAPCSPWTKPFGSRNALYLQFPYSSPVSPTGPVHPVTPELSLGYGLHGVDRIRFQPLSPSPGGRVELPSSQLRRAMPPPPSVGATATDSGEALREAVLLDQHNSESLEAMLQELHDAIEIEPAPENRDADGRGDQNPASGTNKSEEGELKDDIDTLLDLMMPTAAYPEPAAAADTSQHSRDDVLDHSNVDLPAVISGAASPEQDWGLDVDGAAAGHWNNMSSIC